MDKKKRLLWLDGSSGGITPPSLPDETIDGKQVFMVIGDSNAGDTTATTAYGPVTPVGIALKWNGVNTTDVSATDFSNQVGVFGTSWKKFALDYNVNTGKKVVIINRASAGSEFYPNGDNNNWFTSGTLYASAQTEAANCLSFLGLTKLKGIFVHCGVNDATSANLTSDILTGMNSLFTRLLADYPGVPIYVVSTGIDTVTLGVTARKFFFKKAFRDLSDNNALIELVTNADSMAQWGYTLSNHFSQVGYNKIGEQFARSVSMTESNKQVRQVLAMFHDALSAPHAAAWKIFIEGCQSDGWWTNNAIDSLQIYVSSSRNNIFFETANLTTPLDTLFDWNVNANIRTTTSKTLQTNYVPSVCRVNCSLTDYAEGVKIGVNNTPAGTQGILFSPTGGSNRRVFQTTTNVINYNVNDATNTSYATETKFADNSRYATKRNGTTKALFKNGVQVSSAVVAATADTSATTVIGGATSTIDCQYEYYYQVKGSIVDLSIFEGRLETLVAALKI